MKAIQMIEFIVAIETAMATVIEERRQKALAQVPEDIKKKAIEVAQKAKFMAFEHNKECGCGSEAKDHIEHAFAELSDEWIVREAKEVMKCLILLGYDM